MKLTETITNTTITIILTSIAGLFGILLGSIYSEVVPIILPTLIQQLPTTVLLKILSVATLLSLLLIGLTIFIYLHYKPKFQLKFGILWDKNKEAHCPACEKPLSQFGSYRIPGLKTEYKKAFRCVNCDTFVSLISNGEYIELEDARKSL